MFYGMNLRLRVTPIEFYTYPDVMVVEGKPEVADDHDDTLLNPRLILEVLSDATREYDRGTKWEHYRSLPSLTEYLTVAQDTPHIEHWVRRDLATEGLRGSQPDHPASLDRLRLGTSRGLPQDRLVRCPLCLRPNTWNWSAAPNSRASMRRSCCHGGAKLRHGDLGYRPCASIQSCTRKSRLGSHTQPVRREFELRCRLRTRIT
jgi:hypothetical protein